MVRLEGGEVILNDCMDDILLRSISPSSASISLALAVQSVTGALCVPISRKSVVTADGIEVSLADLEGGLGECHIYNRRILIHHRLIKSPELLALVLAHEFSHIYIDETILDCLFRDVRDWFRLMEFYPFFDSLPSRRLVLFGRWLVFFSYNLFSIVLRGLLTPFLLVYEVYLRLLGRFL